MSHVIDLNPALRRRQQTECRHASVTIDAAMADLECDACGKQINPYWFLEKIMGDWNEYSERIREHEEAMKKRHEQYIATLNYRAERLRLEVETLEAKKRQLSNEPINGSPLGKQIKRWRRA